MSQSIQESLDETVRIAEEGNQQKTTLRLLGSAGIRYHCPKFAALRGALERRFTDLEEAINAKCLAEILTKDWSFYHAVTTNPNRLIQEFMPNSKHHVAVALSNAYLEETREPP